MVDAHVTIGHLMYVWRTKTCRWCLINDICFEVKDRQLERNQSEVKLKGDYVMAKLNMVPVNL